MLEAFELASQGQTDGLIPPGSTTFHLLLAIHIAAALTCVVTGAIAALSPKQPGRHPRLGTLYHRSLTVVVASAAWLAALRWPQDAYLLVLGTLSLAAATLGRTARRRRWHGRRWRWIGLHLVGMSASYILLLTAFYVDNGKHLPVWRSLPQLVYWLLPSGIGLPLAARALARYRGLATRRPPTPRRAIASGFASQENAWRAVSKSRTVMNHFHVKRLVREPAMKRQTGRVGRAAG